MTGRIWLARPLASIFYAYCAHRAIQHGLSYRSRAEVSRAHKYVLRRTRIRMQNPREPHSFTALVLWESMIRNSRTSNTNLHISSLAPPPPHRIYSLPKIHKEGIPLRPIVAAIGSPTPVGKGAGQGPFTTGWQEPLSCEKLSRLCESNPPNVP